MAYRSYELKEEELEAAKSAIKQVLPKSIHKGDFMEALENFIDVKIKHACEDLENKIKQTGDYDPEW